ncbi:MAG: hypothetical protein HYZ34_02780 [Ignavibacteriae bacterium]|nr:hypothetical protein [Ignavibacteriota bacterium]
MKQIIYILCLTCLFAIIATSQISQLITHQGYLADSTGQGVTASLPMTFRFYADSTGGAALLEQGFSTVQVTKGNYTIVLDVSSLSFSSQRWLETEVNSELFSPRTRLTSVPYSLQAMSLVGPGSIATGTNAIAGGRNNRARGNYSVVSGGGGNTEADSNSASVMYATVGGGNQNRAAGYAATVSGGGANSATGICATVGGGLVNMARGDYSVVAGGGGPFWSDSNSASGLFSTIPGGRNNKAAGNYSFAAGWRARANHGGTFVWADSASASGTDFFSTGTNQFLIRASGGVGIGTASPQGALDVSSTTGAFIVPRMTTSQRNALSAVNGMIIYNTETNQFNFYENGSWVTK